MNMSFHSLRQPAKVSSQSGQAGLVVMLLTVVLLTVGISVASRSTTDVTLSRQEEESNQVLNAAEAGIEQALSEDFNFAGSEKQGQINVDNKVVNYVVQKKTELKTQLFEGITAQVTLPSIASNQTLRVYWTKNCDPEPASLLVTIYSNSGGTVSSRTLAYNPSCTNNPTGNNFINTSPSSGYRGLANVTVQPGDVYVRIKALYNNVDEILVTGSGALSLPEQYYTIRSTATNNVGTEQRAVEVNRTVPVSPTFMDYAIYSGTTISTN